MTTNNDKNAVGGWGGFVYFRASLRPAQAGTAFRGGVFARPAQAGSGRHGRHGCHGWHGWHGCVLAYEEK